MPPRRCSASAAREFSDMESDEYEGEQQQQQQRVLRCLSCEVDFDPNLGGTCKECYEEANENEEELKLQIEELKSKVSFLEMLSPAEPNAPAADVVLVASGDASAPAGARVPAHRTVLISRSPVFKAMLENDMEESRTGIIKIADVTSDVLRAFVNYLYTAEACLDDQMAYNLFLLGEKYQLKHLKGYCERFLISTLNLEKSIENLTFAHQLDAKQLRAASLEVVSENIGLFTKSEAYQELRKTAPQLVVEVFECYIAKRANTAAGIAKLFGGPLL